MKISLLTPIGNNHHPKYWLSLEKFRNYCQEKGYELEHLYTRMSNIYFSREDLIARPSGDYVLWVDADAEFTPEQFEQLRAHNKDFVGCVAKYYDYKLRSFKWNFGWYIPQAYESLGIWARNPLCNEDIGTELKEVDYTGLHFVLHKRQISDAIAFPKFDPLPMNLIHPKIKGFMSEDGSYCMRAQLLGVKIFVDPTCHVLHWKTLPI